ncbi:MAG: mevalonate kinase, partial [Alkalispirochaeta sp.]
GTERGRGTEPDRGTELPPDRARAFQAHLEMVIRETPDARLPRERCEIISELPIGGGFGSSAALCTALARRILPPESATDRVWSVAHRLEHFFHGTPSGIDTGLSCRSGAWAFRFVRDRGGDAADREGSPGSIDDRSSDTVQKSSGEMEDQTRTAPELPRAEAVSLPPAVLVAGSIPRETSTRDLVAGVRARHDADPNRYGDVLQRLGELSDETARDASRDRSAFALRVDEAQQRLTELGVSSPALERIIATGRSAGAMAGKLSGAGGGGAFFLVCRDTRCAENVRRALSKLDDTPAALFTVPLG